VIDSLKELTITKACQILRLSRRRYYRWSAIPQIPAIRTAWNKITPSEEEAILAAAKEEALVDLRAAGLMVYGHESGAFHCSISTVQRVLKRNRLQPVYEIPRRKRPLKPDIRALMKEPGKIFAYDATEFYLASRLRVVVILILDLGSRKLMHYGIRVRSFSQKDVIAIWDEALWQEEIDTSGLTALADRGTQMKGSRTKAHLRGRWNIRLEFARPYTPDDNAWIEALIKYLKYHPQCPDEFRTVAEVADWVASFQGLYNDHPHSALGYVCPNEEHAGLGDAIREKRKENLLSARKQRLAYYHGQRKGVSGKFLEKDKTEGDFRANSEAVLCQNR